MTTDSNDFETELAPINIEMNDGSVYTLDSERWLRAFRLKYGDEDIGAVIDAFRERVAEHWENETKPWKGITIEWGTEPWQLEGAEETFDDQADLAGEVMYSSLRAPLMAMAMDDLSDEDDESGDGASVIGIRDDDVVEYTGDEMVEHETIEDALSADDADTTE